MSVQFGGGAGGGGATVNINVINSGGAISISGNCVCISGQPVSVSGNFVVLGSGSFAQLSGLPVTASVNVAANVSGNIVYLVNDNVNNVVAISGSIVKTSGQVAQISGQSVVISGQPVSTSISGNVVSISGTATVQGTVSIGNSPTVNTSISGNTVVISDTVPVSTSISGNVVSVSGLYTSINLQSGQTGVSGGAGVLGFAYDYSGLNWVPLAVNTSGSKKLDINASVTANANISGQAVFLGSGSTLGLSGLLLATTAFESGLGNISGVYGPAGIVAWDLSGQTWNPLVVSQSGGNKLDINATVNANANISGQAVFLGSGSVLGLSGLPVSVSGNMVAVSGLWTSINLTSGQTGVSGGQGSLGFAYDYSGLKWTPLATDTSGSNKLLTVASVNVGSNVSGNVVYIASIEGSGITSTRANSKDHLNVWISGQGVLTNVSGTIVSVSGTVTIQGAVTTSVSGNVLTLNPTYTSTTLQSGQVGLSGAIGALGLAYDYSGLNWVPIPTAASGVRVPRVTASGDGVTTSISGNVISISGTATIAGAVTTSVSGNVLYAASIEGSGITSTRANSKDHLNVWMSGQAVTTSVSGNVFAVSGTVTTNTSVSGLWTSINLQSGQTGVSGAAGALNFAYDYSGLNWVPTPTAASGVRTPIVTVSGNSVSTSISGNAVTINPTYTSTTLQSGQIGLSGAVGTLGLVYDYSGLNWVPIPTAASGVRVPRFTASGDGFTTSVSGNVISISGTATIAGAVTTSISGNVVTINPTYTSTTLQSGQVGVSGGVGSLGFAYDYSGLNWAPLATSNSGVRKLLVDAGSINVAANVSGNVVYLASIEGSGITSTRANSKDMLNVWISGQAVTTSVSGNVVAISGTVTTNTSVSGLWASTTLQSGQYGVSGGGGGLNFVYDYSGLNWVPMPTTTSGVRVPRFSNSGDSCVTSVSGNVVKPQTPTFINSIESFRISVASGGVQLSSFLCVACTVRNIGNSGDVVFVGSLSSPPYMGTSGQAWPAISGKGFWLRDGDAITLNTTDTANIKVTANLSGTPVSYVAVG